MTGVAGPTSARPGEQNCEAWVEGSVASYPCSLPAGHRRPAEDPEPCYAVEVPSSARAWRAWRERMDHPLVEAPVTGGHDGCGGKPRLDDGAVFCGGCGGKIGDVVGAPREVYRPPSPVEEDLEEAAGGAGYDLARRLVELDERLRERDRLVEIARHAIEQSWEYPAEAAVDALLAHFNGGDR